MKVFVYGTLKRGGVLHSNIKHCKYLGVDKIHNFAMFKLGWFPAVVPTIDARECVYGEIYEVDKTVLDKLDAIEGKGVLYNRTTVDTKYGDAMMYVYSKDNNMKTWDYPKVPYGYFVIENKKWNLVIGDDKYKGDASKVVFDMRFFDTSAGRCDTNKQYMNLYKERTWDLDINTSVEDVFLTDLIIQCNLEEI